MNAHTKKVSKIKRLTALSVLIAILAPTLVTATVILTYQYNINSSNATPYLFLTTGENYNTANTLGLIYAKTQTFSSGGSSYTYIPSGTVDVNVSDGAYSEYLLNVLAVYNISSGLKVPVYAYINASSIPSGVTVYISNASLIFNGNTVTTSTKGANLITLTSSNSPESKEIQITTSSTTTPVLYIGFEISSSTSSTPANAPASFTLSVQFSVQ
jgi:hypothetical protein